MTGRLRSGLIALALLLWPAASQAAVDIHFYSHDFGRAFPHAFVVLKGTIDATQEPVDTNIGFSATSVSPAMLVKPFEGAVEIGIISADYISRSKKQFSLVLSDDEYRAVMNVVEAWRAKAQPSYSLNTSNCVHFIADIALALKLNAEPRRGLMRNPRGFLERVKADSLAVLAARTNPPPAAIGVAGGQARDPAGRLEALAE